MHLLWFVYSALKSDMVTLQFVAHLPSIHKQQYCYHCQYWCGLTDPPPPSFFMLSALTLIKSSRLSSMATSSRDPTRLSLRPCTAMLLSCVSLVLLSPGPSVRYLYYAELFRFIELWHDRFLQGGGELNGLDVNSFCFFNPHPFPGQVKIWYHPKKYILYIWSKSKVPTYMAVAIPYLHIVGH